MFAPYLGKREYPPAGPIFLTTVATDVDEAIDSHEWLAAPWWRKKARRSVNLTVTDPADFRSPARDLRRVLVENSDGRDDPPDWLAPLR